MCPEAIEFAFKVHQFVGGFSDDCLASFERLRDMFRELIGDSEGSEE